MSEKVIMKRVTLVSFCIFLSACSAQSLNSGAEQVRITHSEPANDCVFLGEVTGSQGNFFTGAWTSNASLETGARNDLKNKALKMGGNRIVIITQRAGQTGTSYFGSGSNQQTNVTLSGSVYRCQD